MGPKRRRPEIGSRGPGRTPRATTLSPGASPRTLLSTASRAELAPETASDVFLIVITVRWLSNKANPDGVPVDGTPSTGDARGVERGNDGRRLLPETGLDYPRPRLA